MVAKSSLGLGDRSIPIQQLEQAFTIIDQAEVTTFLDTNFFLVDLMQESLPQLKTLFPHAKLYLAVVADPELENQTQLVLTVSPDTDEPEQAFEKFQQFKKTWWNKASFDAKDALLIVLQYK